MEVSTPKYYQWLSDGSIMFKLFNACQIFYVESGKKKT